jgi:uncharacterized protein (TIGR04222 family)
MNPFLWPGPQFLVLYAVLIAVAVVVNVIWLRARPARPMPRVTSVTTDPYRIASLRGGDEEAIRVAIFNLLDRRLLTVEGDALRARRSDAAVTLLKPLEGAVIGELGTGSMRVRDLLASTRLQAVAATYTGELQQLGLVPDEEEVARRRRIFAILWLVLMLVAGIKLAWALAHGRTNVFLLVFLAFVATISLHGFVRSRRTTTGAALLTHVRALTSRLKAGAKSLRPGGGSADALLLAAVYGLAALPGAVFPDVRRIFPNASTSGGGDGSSSCSSGCGGGGGGGCGGCGG